MCAVFGALLWRIDSQARLALANEIFDTIYKASHQRGRDGRGFVVNSEGESLMDYQRSVHRVNLPHSVQALHAQCYRATIIGNTRAEPTTEYVADKSIVDQQPYNDGHQWVVHNGTISNDWGLRTGRHLSSIDSAVIAERLHFNEPYYLDHFAATVKELKGSYAILAMDDRNRDEVFVAANYRPVWYAETEVGVFFASCRTYFPDNLTPVMLTPYTMASFRWDGALSIELAPCGRAQEASTGKALVVCSGGMDSVVAATYAQRVLGLEVELIHFLYGSRAEGPEVVAVQAVAQALGVPVRLMPLPVYSPSDSPLLQADSAIAGGEAGAEFAHEWVPARNLLLLSVATAYAEAHGFDTIVLGNNLEEAGAYPDNEPEFIAKFNDLLPFAVGDGKRMKVIMPVGNMMKHEIVRLGLDLGAPMHLTWSCYRAGELHCGKCGPCYMRRKAFEINHHLEVISYASEL